ncbi:hypothetical protein [Sphingomonas abietis]|uniref:Uncharacterized protein n=1 Tax=Sphingomonas abietis TaxID=3012344 RepID=A0ABY7NL55_9SPHN|nr:hypothetical protein [Sphingomonas abietis]WBO21977.1 hypothetical protein PBT88_17715 [Sphingomonas abietis]
MERDNRVAAAAVMGFFETTSVASSDLPIQSLGADAVDVSSTCICQ